MSDEFELPDRDPLPVRADRRRRPARSSMPWCPSATIRHVGASCSTVSLSGDGDLLGWSADDLSSVSADDLVHPDDRDGLSDVAAHVRAAGSRFAPMHLRMLGRDRRYWWTQWQCCATPDRLAVTATGVDYGAPAGEIGPPVGLFRWDVDADAVWWSTELLEMFALTVGPPATYRAFLAAVLADDRDDVAHAIHAAVVTGEPYVITFRCPTACGRDRWFHASGRRYPVTAGQPRRVGGMVKYLNPPGGGPAVGPIGCG